MVKVYNHAVGQRHTEGLEGTITDVIPILQKQNFKRSIHPKFKMSRRKLPRILLNTKITIIPYSRFIVLLKKN